MSIEQEINDNISISKIQKNVIESIIQNELSDLFINFEENFNRKIFLIEEKLTKTFDEFESKLNQLKDKHNFFSEQTQTIKFIEEKIDSIEKKTNKNSDDLINYDAKFTSLRKDFSDACFKYDKLFLNNLTIPGLIGNSCKFQNFKEFVEFSLNKFYQFEQCKQKQMACMNSFKDFTEMKFGNIISDVNKFKSHNFDYIDEKVNDVRSFITEQTNLIHDKLPDIKAENTYYHNNILDQIKNIKEERKDLQQTKNVLIQEIENTYKLMQKKEIETQNKIISFKKEFSKMKKNLMNIIEFIKDIRFKRNIKDHKEVLSAQINKLVHELSGNLKTNKQSHSNKNNNNSILNYRNNSNIYKAEISEDENSEDLSTRLEKKYYSSNNVNQFKLKSIYKINEDNNSSNSINDSINDSSIMKSTEKDLNNKSIDENIFQTDDKNIKNENGEKMEKKETKKEEIEDKKENKKEVIDEEKKEKNIILNSVNSSDDSLDKNKNDDCFTKNLIMITVPNIDDNKKKSFNLPKIEKKIFHLKKNQSVKKMTYLSNNSNSSEPLFYLQSNSVDISKENKKEKKKKIKNKNLTQLNSIKKKNEENKLIHDISVKFLKPLRNSLVNIPNVIPKNNINEN